MKKFLSLFLFIISFSFSFATEITLSAAASLKEVMGEIVQKFEAENPKVRVNVNLGGSGALKNQILAGAPVDIVFFASQKDLEDLAKKDMVEEKYSGDILKNRIVIAGRNSVNSIEDIVGKNIAIGTPETVPAGKYAKEVLQNSGIWEKVQSNLVLSKDVRSAAQYVDLYEVDYALIYKTDAQILKNSKISYIIPEKYHTPIVYSYGIIKKQAKPEVIKFYEFLNSDFAKKMYLKYNFELAK